MLCEAEPFAELFRWILFTDAAQIYASTGVDVDLINLCELQQMLSSVHWV